MSLYSLDEPYSVATWYEHTGIYDLWTGTDLQLDLMRQILDSDAYIYRGYSFPNISDAFVATQRTISAVLNVPALSYLIGITGVSGNSNQFTLRIYDKGAQTDIYWGQFAWYPTVLSNMQRGVNIGDVINFGDEDKPFSTHLLRDPLVILPPGQLQWQLTNTQPTVEGSYFVQVLLSLAVPKNTLSLDTRKVETPVDQTGLATLANLALLD